MKWLLCLLLALGVSLSAWATVPVSIKYTDKPLIWAEDVTFVLEDGSVVTSDAKQRGVARAYQRYGVAGLTETAQGVELLVPKGNSQGKTKPHGQVYAL